VVTTSFNVDYPLIRFGTGDLSAVLPGASRADARTSDQGLLGRADQTTKVKGCLSSVAGRAMCPASESCSRRARRRQSDGSDRMTLHVEIPARKSSHADSIIDRFAT